MTRALITQAIDALEGVWHDKAMRVKAALRAHLEQPEQEPVGWDDPDETAACAASDMKPAASMRVEPLGRYTRPLYAAPPVPAGMVMVPVEPTPEMRLIS